MQEHQTALYNWISHQFFISLHPSETLPLTHTRTHKSTHTDHCAVSLPHCCDSIKWLVNTPRPPNQLPSLSLLFHLAFFRSHLLSFILIVLSLFSFLSLLPFLPICLSCLISLSLLSSPTHLPPFLLFPTSFISLHKSHSINTTSEQGLQFSVVTFGSILLSFIIHLIWIQSPFFSLPITFINLLCSFLFCLAFLKPFQFTCLQTFVSHHFQSFSHLSVPLCCFSSTPLSCFLLSFSAPYVICRLHRGNGCF